MIKESQHETLARYKRSLEEDAPEHFAYIWQMNCLRKLYTDKPLKMEESELLRTSPMSFEKLDVQVLTFDDFYSAFERANEEEKKPVIINDFELNHFVLI